MGYKHIFQGIKGILGGTATATAQTIQFSNANNVTFGVDGNTVTASIPAIPAGNTGSVSAGTTIATLGEVVFSNSNGVSFGANGQTVTGSVATSLTNIRFSAGTTSNLLSAVTFSDSNGVSFGLNASTVTASVATSLTNVRVSAGTTSNLLSAITFSNSNGVSFGINASTLTGSVATSLTNIRVSAGTTSNLLSAITFSNLNGVTFGLDGSTLTASVAAAVAQTNQTIGVYASSNTTLTSSGTFDARSMSIRGIGGMTVGYSGGEILLSGAAGGAGELATTVKSVATVNSVGTIARYAPEDHQHGGIPIVSIVGNTSGTTTQGNMSLNLAGGPNITLSCSTNGGAMTVSVSAGAAGGAGTFTHCFEPFQMQDGSATMTGSLSQLNLQPFSLPVNLSFGQIRFIAIANANTTSISNSVSHRLTNSTQRHSLSSSYTIGNTDFVDLFLFSRGAGISTSELDTFASTRNTFITNYSATHAGDATLTNTAGGSIRGSYSISMMISYPFLTSYTSTSVSTNSTYTGWSSGYTTWTSSITTQATFTISTSAARTISIGSTFPATIGWSGAKLMNINLATSLSAGEYWLGYLRHSSSSSSSSSSNSFVGAAGGSNSYSATFNHTALANTRVMTFVGKSATISASLGSQGFITTNNMAVQPGLGSFSGTWASNTTYLNNMGNPVGAVALTQIRSNISMFRSWFRMASNMPV